MLDRRLMFGFCGGEVRLMKKTATENECLPLEGGFVFTAFNLGRGRNRWVIHRGGWPQGRGSARTLIAGGLPLSEVRAEFKICFFCNLFFLDIVVGLSTSYLII